MKRTVIVFSILILCIMMLFQVSKLALFSGNISHEVLIAVIALVFFFIGVLLDRNTRRISGQKKEGFIDYSMIRELSISNREYDVLLALSEDLTNREIADRLYISESTTKKHLTRIFSKLEVSRRSEALRKAQELNIIQGSS